MYAQLFFLFFYPSMKNSNTQKNNPIILQKNTTGTFFSSFMKLDFIKKVWAFSTFLFIFNYSLYIFLFFVRFPISPLPNYINILSLVVSHSVGLFRYKNVTRTLQESNLFCIGFFLTFPSTFLLLPFYLLGIYNFMGFMLSNKKIFNFGTCMSISSFHVVVGRTALMSEVIFFIIIFILFIVRFTSIWTLLSYGIMIRQQYINNPNMKSVVKEMQVKCDTFSKYLPENLYKYYNECIRINKGN